MNLIFAELAPSSVSIVDRLRQTPSELWGKVGLGILIVVLTVMMLRTVAKVNRVVLCFGLLIAGAAISFNWIHERNEPTWATPVVQIVAGFFPGKVRS